MRDPAFDGYQAHLANAYVIRLLVVMMEMVAPSRHTRGNLYAISIGNMRPSLGSVSHGHDTYINKQIEPARLRVAFSKIASNGPAGEEITFMTSPATNNNTERKTKPVKIPIPTVASMILGPSTVGFGISSTIWATASNPVRPIGVCQHVNSFEVVRTL